MFCHKCGTKITDDDSFCNECGTAINTNKKKKNYWLWLSYVWTVVVNLITVVIVFAIYDNVYVDFEVIVVSILILIYLSFQSFAMIHGKITAETTLALDGEFKRIRKLLNDEPDEYETKEVQEAQKKVNKAMVKMYINAIFLFIIYLVALFKLLTTL